MSDAVVQVNTGGFTNAFLVRGDAGYVLVDTGSPGSADRILERLHDEGGAPEEVRLILITHGHVDHFGSAAELKRRTGAPVAVHTLDAEALRQGTHVPGSLNPTGRLMALAMRLSTLGGGVVPDHAPTLEPDVVFLEDWRLDEYGVAAQVLHTPGHTPGSVSVLLDSGELILGDMLMGKLMGLIRSPGPPIVAWELERNWQSTREVQARSPRIVYAGHGGPFSPEQLRGVG
jgi:hydroxyacylglutathione hydrolase